MRMYRARWFTIGFNVFAIATAIVAVGLYVVMTAWLLILPLAGLRHYRR